jgi:hypothetical protein
MMRKGGNRFSEQIMLEQKRRPGRRSSANSSCLSLARSWNVAPITAALALLALPGCSSLTDLGYVDQPAVADNIHAWVGQEAAARWGAPISLANLTEDERTLRDLAFPLIQPAYTRDRWDQVVYEYGQKRDFQRSLWIPDPTLYYVNLIAANYRSSAGRYNRLNDDVRNDVVRMGPFFYIAHKVIEADRKRQATMAIIPDVSPPEQFNALARVSENNLTIAWVQASLAQRAASYRFALNRLAVSEPEDLATNVDISLTLMQQQMVSNQLVPPGPFGAGPVGVTPVPGAAPPPLAMAAPPPPPPVPVAVAARPKPAVAMATKPPPVVK